MASSSLPGALIAVSEDKLQKFFPPELRRRLEELLPEAVTLDPEGLSEEEWRKRILEINPRIILTGWGTLPLPPRPPENLEYVCHLTGSVRASIPRSYLEADIPVTNWGDSISHTIAEMGLFLTLHLLRNGTAYQDNLHYQGKWKEGIPPDRSLFGRRVGIHGFGRIARKLVDLLQPFQVTLSAYSPPVPPALFQQAGVQRADSLESLFSENEIVIELEGLTPETRGMVRAEHLAAMADHSLLVVVGRAGLIQEEALLREALSGRLQFGLDVFWEEPLPAQSPLRGLRNVALFPHTAGPTPDQLFRCGERALENLRRFRDGETLLEPLDPKAYDRIT